MALPCIFTCWNHSTKWREKENWTNWALMFFWGESWAFMLESPSRGPEKLAGYRDGLNRAQSNWVVGNRIESSRKSDRLSNLLSTAPPAHAYLRWGVVVLRTSPSCPLLAEVFTFSRNLPALSIQGSMLWFAYSGSAEAGGWSSLVVEFLSFWFLVFAVSFRYVCWAKKLLYVGGHPKAPSSDLL